MRNRKTKIQTTSRSNLSSKKPPPLSRSLETQDVSGRNSYTTAKPDTPRFMKSPRNKGHAFERFLVKLFRTLGYKDCVTSRAESKRLDDLGVDLCYTGIWQVQAKAVERLGSAHETLERMPKTDNKINLVFHKRNNKGVVVAMQMSDFIKLVDILRESGANLT